jgi:hypothetical protein
MHVEAMNFSGMADAWHAAVLVSQSIRCAFGAIAWNNAATKYTGVACFIEVLGRNLAALLIARSKYRLTPQGTDGQSNCQRFSDEQKQAMV